MRIIPHEYSYELLFLEGETVGRNLTGCQEFVQLPVIVDSGDHDFDATVNSTGMRELNLLTNVEQVFGVHSSCHRDICSAAA